MPSKGQQGYSKEEKLQFIQILNKKNGNVSKACDAFNINRASYYEWMEEEWFSDLVDAVREAEIDESEEMARILRKGIPQYKMTDEGEIERDEEGEPIVIGWIEKPDAMMIRHHLDSKAKKRGYGKTLDLNHNMNKMPSNVVIGLKVHKKKKK